MSDFKQAAEAQIETDSSGDAAAAIDPEKTLDFMEVLLSLRDEIAELRKGVQAANVEAQRELRAIRVDVEFVRKQVKNLGLRVTSLQSDSEQLEAEVGTLRSSTPAPFDVEHDDLLRNYCREGKP